MRFERGEFRRLRYPENVKTSGAETRAPKAEADGAAGRRKRPRKRGRKRKWKLTPARLAQRRVAAWKHGRYAQTVTKQEVAYTHLDQALPGMGAAFVLQAYRKAELEGDFSDVEKIAAQAMAEAEVIRRRAADDVLERGVAFDEPVINGKGEPIGRRRRANPVLDPLRRMNEQLGHTAKDLQLTRPSGEEGAGKAAMVFRLQRDAQLRALDRERRQLPPPPENPGD
jgi:hypothetical protein